MNKYMNYTPPFPDFNKQQRESAYFSWKYRNGIPLSHIDFELNSEAFQDKPLIIKFGEKTKGFANIHILTGKNGSGKSTILLKLINTVNQFEEYEEYDDKDKIRKYADIAQSSCHNLSYIDYCDFQKDPNLTIWKRENKEPNEFLCDVNAVNNLGSNNNNFEKYFTGIYPDIMAVEQYELLLEVNKQSGSKRALNLTESDFEKLRKKVNKVRSLEKFISQIYDVKLRILRSADKNLIYEITDKNQKVYAVEFSKFSLGYKKLISFGCSIFEYLWSIAKDNEVPEELPFLLILDEIETPFHPEAQQRILPALQKMFPNAEIVCTTHSPFITNSVDNAWIYELEDENYIDAVLTPRPSNTGESYIFSARKDFNITTKFGGLTNELLEKFYTLLESREKNIKNSQVVLDLLGKNSAEIDAIIGYNLEKYGKNN